MKLTKKEREEVRAMFDGRCAYCGKLLADRFCVDHIKPIFRGFDEKPAIAGEDVKDNLFPSCQRCNLHKHTLTLDKFREAIRHQVDILKERNYNYKLAADFGLVKETGNDVIFWFEKYQEGKKMSAYTIKAE